MDFDEKSKKLFGFTQTTAVNKQINKLSIRNCHNQIWNRFQDECAGRINPFSLEIGRAHV